jgi:hypothetical protein
MKQWKSFIRVRAAGSILTPDFAGEMLYAIEFLMICILFTFQNRFEAMDWAVAASRIRGGPRKLSFLYLTTAFCSPGNFAFDFDLVSISFSYRVCL